MICSSDKLSSHQFRSSILLRLLLVACIAFIVGCVNSSDPRKAASDAMREPDEARETISIAAASDLRFAFDEVLKELRTTHPELEVKTTFGSSGNFYSQIVNDAPFDLFLSANTEFPSRLVDDGKAIKESLFHYGNGLLVVWTPDTSGIEIDGDRLEFLCSPRIQKISIANPKHAPYGIAAVEALRSAGVFESVRDKLVMGDSVSQGAQFVESGAADVGLIAYSLAMSDAMRKNGRSTMISSKLYKPLRQSGVTMTSSTKQEQVAKVRQFLESDAGQSILSRYGLSRRD